MNRDQACALVRDTFTHAFDKYNFHNFAINLLNKIDESKAFFCNSTYIKDAFKEHVSRFERLGTYTSPESEKLDVLIVHLTNESKLERARTAIRNFVADHLKQRDNKDAALVVFVSPTERQWRFSYVKMEYATVKKESGKVDVTTRLTPARRYSYIVGEGESCHTAQTRFLDLLKDTENNPTLARIEDAFSVEAVTKEFFTRYAELFGEFNKALERLVAKDKTIRDEFKVKSVNIVDFAKKLMGQIVFLYFLQKKGWLGVAQGQDWGTGPHDFVRRLANGTHGKYENFFNDILEPLFYDTLAFDRGHEAWCNRFNCRIPFLDGGLFEPLANYDWRKTDIILPNKLFTNAERTDAGDTGTGVLDVFDRYNFTVNEAHPLEREVAIDPEMLGKVFENLIEENRRKGLGSYYTPREIVHYMCQESLINYLETALNTSVESIAPAKPRQPKLFGEPEPEQENLKITVRHEVVPRSDIETFIHLGDQYLPYEEAKQSGTIGRDYPKPPKSIEQHARLMDEKLADITICDPAVGSGAFPVGMMTEIVRARSALTPYFNDVHDRTPYHFKRHAIQNCLYGVDIDPGAVEIAKLRLWLSLVVDEEDVKQIKPLPNLLYKIVTGDSLLGVEKNLFNEQLFRQLEELKPRYFDEPDKDKKDRYKQQIEDTIHALTNGKKAFDYEIYFSEVFHRNGGFDVVIANPPYVRQEKIKEFKPVLKAARYECFTGTADLFVYFYERGVKLLRAGGAIALITSNKYYRAGYGGKLRGFLVRELTLNRLIDFGDAPVFEAIAYASILTGVKSFASKDSAALGYTWEKDAALDRIAQIVRERGQKIRQDELKPDGWRLESPAVFRLLEKLRRAGMPLGDHVKDRIYRGIVTGLNEAFVVDGVTRQQMIAEDKKSSEIIKPWLRGRDVKRWNTTPKDFWLCYVGWETKIALYPAIKKHLNGFRKELMDRPEVKAGRVPWYAMSRYASHYWQEFAVPKIVVPAIAGDMEFAYDAAGYFLNNKASLAVPNDPYYCLAILNSSVSLWFAKQVFATKEGGFYDFEPRYCSQFPIPVAAPQKQKRVERLVERILAVKLRDVEGDVSALEREIDQLVYALYGLTPDEIKLIEDTALR
jgi:type I restriction-modification system DNA methylase subunit